MGSAAVLAAALTTGGAKARSLWVGGVDVLREPGGAAGTSYGSIPGTIRVREAGPGGVSSLSVEVSDPGKALAFTDGASVLYWDHTENWPVFAGVLDHFAALPAFGSQARRWTLEATGVEAVLDWMVLPSDVTFPVATAVDRCVQSLAGQALGVGIPIRTFQSTSASSSIAQPVAPAGALGQLETAVTIEAGSTLREAIRQVLAARNVNPFGTSLVLFTVDFFNGLRIDSAFEGCAGLVVNDGPAGSPKLSKVSYEVDATGPRQVYVVGANAPGTGVVSGGSGKPGPIAKISDVTIDTQDKRQAAGAAYLADFIPQLRGTFDLEDVTFAELSTPGTSRVCALSPLILTLSTAGISGAEFTIFGITKTFAGGLLETWTVEFGGQAPSLTRALRRLTRDTRA